MTDFEELKNKYAPETDESLPCARGGVTEGEAVGDGGVVQDNAPSPEVYGEQPPLCKGRCPEGPEGSLTSEKTATDADADNPVIPSEPAESREPKDPAPSASGGGSLTDAPDDGRETPVPADAPQTEGDPSSPAASRDDDASTPKKKRRVPLFWKIYLIAVTVTIMLICGLLGFFRIYLKEYEQTRPLNTAKEAVSALAAGEDRPEFTPSEAGEFDAAASIAKIYAEAGGSADAEVIEKVGVSTEQTPVFSVREDGREICTVRLREGEKHRFFRDWQVDGVFFTGDNSVDITITADTRLLLNGVQVGDAYVVSRDEALAGYTDFGDVTPKCVRYQIEGLLYEPEITLLNDYCYPNVEFKNGVWVVTYPGAESNRDDAVAIAYNAAQAYVTYASSQDSPFAPLDRCSTTITFPTRNKSRSNTATHNSTH